MVPFVLFEANDGFPRQPDRASLLHRYRTGYQTVGQPRAALAWRSKIPPDTTDSAWPSYPVHDRLHRYRTGYQTVGQPRLAFSRPSPPRLDLEEFDPRRANWYRVAQATVAIPTQPWLAYTRPALPQFAPEDYPPQRARPYPFGTAAVVVQLTQPWLAYLTPRPTQQIEEQPRAPADLTGLHRFRPGYQTVGQPPLALTRPPLPRLESEEYQPARQDLAALHRFRQSFQTVGQPLWMFYWRSTIPDTTDSAWPHYDLTGLLHTFRPTYQTVGQPLWMMGWRSKVPDIPDDTWPHYDPTRTFWQFQTMLPTYGMAAIAGPAQPVLYEANDGFPRQPDRTGPALLLFNRGTVAAPTQSTPWFQYAWRSTVPPQIEDFPARGAAPWIFNTQQVTQGVGSSAMRSPATPIFYESNDGFPRQPDRSNFQTYRQIVPPPSVYQPTIVFRRWVPDVAAEDLTPRSTAQAIWALRSKPATFMRVMAVKPGIYDGQYRSIQDVFDVLVIDFADANADPVLGWMIQVPQSTPGQERTLCGYSSQLDSFRRTII